jgi:hypothetical protein
LRACTPIETHGQEPCLKDETVFARIQFVGPLRNLSASSAGGCCIFIRDRDTAQLLHREIKENPETANSSAQQQ